MAFGPQLIGEAEKPLNALLQRFLVKAGLDETEWVTLRLAAQGSHEEPLANVVSARAHVADPDRVVEDLTARGLLHEEAPTAAGVRLVQRVQVEVADVSAPIWSGLDANDVAATERVLTAVAQRARAVLHHAESGASGTESTTAPAAGL